MLRKIALLFAVVVFVAAAVFVAGPRVDVDYRPRAVALPVDLDAYLRDGEARFPAVVPGAEKTIVWARLEKTRTPLAIVYLHGFSATRQETAPLCERVAAHFGANLYYTRLTGHGLGGEALAGATVNDWLNDAEEALRIGERLGEKVVVVGCSTGGALAAWLAAKADEPNVLGYVLLSPNFAPKDPKTRYLTWPWANQFIPKMVGEQMTWPQLNAQHARYWTTSYPTIALIPMMGLCKVAQALDLTRIEKPLLMIYSPRDQVVDVAAMESAFRRWGAQRKEVVPIVLEGSKETHLIAGDIRAPGGTQPVAEAIVRFVEGIR